MIINARARRASSCGICTVSIGELSLFWSSAPGRPRVAVGRVLLVVVLVGRRALAGFQLGLGSTVAVLLVLLVGGTGGGFPLWSPWPQDATYPSWPRLGVFGSLAA